MDAESRKPGHRDLPSRQDGSAAANRLETDSNPQSAICNPQSPVPVAIAVVEQDGRFLIGRRPDDVPLAGLWEFPGGKVEPGETPRAAAARESLEETGLAVSVGEACGEVVHRFAHGLLRVHFFACRPLDPGAAPRAPFRWVAAAELARCEFPAANAALIAELLARHGISG